MNGLGNASVSACLLKSHLHNLALFTYVAVLSAELACCRQARHVDEADRGCGT